MRHQTSSTGFAYIEEQFKECKGRIELQRRIVERLHAIDADTTQAEASLNSLMEDQATKLRIMAYLEKWAGRMQTDVGSDKCLGLWSRLGN